MWYEYLIQRHPAFFQDMARIPGQPFYPIALGFECAEGWRELLDKLLVDLQIIYDALPEDRREGVCVVHQIKEKFGTLRFYISTGTQEMYDRIDQAERDSASICEKCGSPGKLHTGGWWLTLCPECALRLKRSSLEEEVPQEDF